MENIFYTSHPAVGKQITPLTRLEPGSPVRVNNCTGYVIRSKVVPAHPCGEVVLHEIRLTHKQTRVSPNKYKITNINKMTQPNYSHVYAL